MLKFKKLISALMSAVICVSASSAALSAMTANAASSSAGKFAALSIADKNIKITNTTLASEGEKTAQFQIRGGSGFTDNGATFIKTPTDDAHLKSDISLTENRIYELSFDFFVKKDAVTSQPFTTQKTTFGKDDKCFLYDFFTFEFMPIAGNRYDSNIKIERFELSAPKTVRDYLRAHLKTPSKQEHKRHGTKKAIFIPKRSKYRLK